MSLLLLSFTKNLGINAGLDRAYLKKVEEGFELRGACLVAFKRLPPWSKGQEGEQSKGLKQESVEEQEGGESVESEEEEIEEEEIAEEEEEETKEEREEGGFAAEGSKEEEGKKDYWKPRQEPYALELNGKEYSIFIEDEGGKLNVNAITEENREIFQRLLEARGISQETATVVTDSLLDWLDKDDRPHSSGAEGKYYESLPESYPCRNGPLNFLEELTLVRGTSPEVYERIKKDLTIYTEGLKINPNSASREVIHAVLGIDLQEAAQVVAFTREKGGIKDAEELKELFFTFGVVGKDFEKARNLITTTTSPYITIRSVGSTGRNYRIIVDKGRENILAVYPE